VVCISLLTRVYALAGIFVVIAGVLLLRWSWENGAHPNAAPDAGVKPGDPPLHSRTMDGPGLWAMAVFLIANGSFFLSYLFGWFYLWTVSPEWQMPDTPPLSLLITGIAGGAVLAGCVVVEKLVRGLLFPLGYALLLVPFGEELVPLLQTFTAHISVILLHLSGIAAEMEGVFITTPAGFFEVAEECSGVNFLIAMLAYAVFAAHLCFKSWTRRIVFVAAALATTIFANALRAYGTMVAAEFWGIEAAGGIDHIFYGWIFFGLVILIVMLVARRWFDRPANDVAVDVNGLDGVPRFAGAAKMVLPAALAIPLLFAGWALLIGGRSAPLPETMMVAAPPGWRVAGADGTAWAPRFDGADQRLLRHFVDARGRRVTVAIGGYERQAEGREVVAFGQGAVDPDSQWAWSAALPAVDGAKTERLLHPGPVLRDAATWYVVDRAVTGDPRRAKLAGLKARLLGGDPRALSLIVSSEAGQGGRDAVEDFVSASGGAKVMADRALKTR